MNRKYIGLGIIFLILVTIILCIFLIPSASKESHQVVIGNEDPVATTFAPVPTTPLPQVTPTCLQVSEGTDTGKLQLSKVRIDAAELYRALTTTCAGISVLELLEVEITGLAELRYGSFEPLKKVVLPNLRRFVFDRLMFHDGRYTAPSEKTKYLENLSEQILKDDFLFLKTKNDSDWTLENLSSELNLDSVQIKINRLQILNLDRTTGLVEFKRIKRLGNGILTSVKNDPNFVLRNLTAQLAKLDVTQILPKADTLTALDLYYSSLFSATADPSLNLHTFIPACTGLTELHLHLFDPPFAVVDTKDLVGLTKLKKFSFQYGGASISEIRLTHSTAQVTLPSITYVYIATEWGKLDPKLIEAFPALFPNLESIIFDSYSTADHNRILNQLLKMPSLLSITFYSYDLIPNSGPKTGTEAEARDSENSKTFLRQAGITAGLHDFVLTRSSNKERWQGRELRYFEKEGFARLTDD